MYEYYKNIKPYIYLYIMDTQIFIKSFIDSVINNAINNITRKSFYLIKFSSISNKYISSEVLYKNIINNRDIKTCTISDILYFTSKNLKTILPIPILDGKYVSENYLINNLPSKLIVIFVNMNILNKSFPLSINNSTALSYIMNMITTNTGAIANIPPPPTPVLNNIEETFMDDNREKYKDEITILKNMGFTNEDKIVESLIVSNGDVNSAIHYYLE